MFWTHAQQDPGMDIPSERQYMPTSQPERMRMLELLEQIPLKVCCFCTICCSETH